MSERKRLLNDLRVIDLRAELEKRNLDKSGVRGVLIQRLTKRLEEEGHDPATYNFELADTKTPTKRTRRSESTVEQETEEAPTMEDMIVQDDAGEEEETEQSHAKASSNEEPNDNTEEKMEVDEKANRKRESKEESEATQAKKPCIENDKEEDLKVENNTDAEDSINLDLGEDELLNEEADNNEKTEKKDDAACEDTAEATDDNSAATDDATTTSGAPGNDQQEVNAEAPATRLVNDERPS